MYDSVFYVLHSRRNEFFPDRENVEFVDMNGKRNQHSQSFMKHDAL